MPSTPRELVLQTLEGRSPSRAPRHLWLLPWSTMHCPDEVERIRAEFPDDFVYMHGHLPAYPPTTGDPYTPGVYVDEWGATFINVHAGVIGEVKEPLIRDWSTDGEAARFPREWLAVDRDSVNRDCASTDRFTMAGACPRPFEQLQFLRGTENVLIDLAEGSPEALRFVRRMHRFYCELLTAWVATDVDALHFMDDWGSQRGLLIRPSLWRSVFRPMYAEYVQIAHAAGKKAFMHSDGHILAVLPDLVEIGVDAVNSQIFCMGIESVAAFAGRITFWGEIDRQHLLPEATPAEIDQAVRKVHQALWREGRCIAQCEFGAGARPENVRQVFASWQALTERRTP